MAGDDAGGMTAGPGGAMDAAFSSELQTEINNRTTVQVLDSVLEAVIRAEVGPPASADAPAAYVWTALALDVGVVARRIGNTAEGALETP